MTTVGVVKRKLQVKCIPNHVCKILCFTNVNDTAIYRVLRQQLGGARGLYKRTVA